MGPRLSCFAAGLIAEIAIQELADGHLLVAVLNVLLAVLILLVWETVQTMDPRPRPQVCLAQALAAMDRALRQGRRFSMSGRRHQSVP